LNRSFFCAAEEEWKEDYKKQKYKLKRGQIEEDGNGREV
jgi:hypothetical protein